MEEEPNFNIQPNGRISTEFLKRNIQTFKQALEYVKQLSYRRNTNKEDLITVFTDNCGTCSTKHGLLKTLAYENHFKGINLILGLFKMNAINTPKIAKTFQYYQLNYIPEAHVYLRFNNQIVDVTNSYSAAADFINYLIEETAIKPEQLISFKVAYHKNYLSD